MSNVIWPKTTKKELDERVKHFLLLFYKENADVFNEIEEGKKRDKIGALIWGSMGLVGGIVIMGAYFWFGTREIPSYEKETSELMNLLSFIGITVACTVIARCSFPKLGGPCTDKQQQFLENLLMDAFIVLENTGLLPDEEIYKIIKSPENLKEHARARAGEFISKIDDLKRYEGNVTLANPVFTESSGSGYHKLGKVTFDIYLDGIREDSLTVPCSREWIRKLKESDVYDLSYLDKLCEIKNHTERDKIDSASWEKYYRIGELMK